MKPIDSHRGKSTKFRNKKPKFQENLAHYFSDYSNNTTIHGMKYLGEKNRSIAEKLWWMLLMSISLYMCAYVIIKTYEKWETSPVIVSFAKTLTPIWKIPFPAVTICPETQCRQTVYNYTEAYHKYEENIENMTEKELREFEQVNLICDNVVLDNGSKTVEYDTIEFFSKVTPHLDDVFWQCKWFLEEPTECSQIFSPILTEQGVCYTFNMLDREELFTNIVFHNGNNLHHGIKSTHWSLETGYSKEVGANTFPRRATTAGLKASFILLMVLYEQDLDYICKSSVQGFQMFLHNPVEMPTLSQHYFEAPLNQEVVVAIKPDMMTTSEGLRDYEYVDRQCYFGNEKKLKYFQIYTQRNCEVECLTNYTLAKCGCVSYHMPHKEEIKLCGAGSTLCVREAQDELQRREIELDIESFTKDLQSPLENTERCNCLPACTSTTYNAETSQTVFNWPKLFEVFKVNFSEYPGIAMTRVTLFFKEQQFITSERSEWFGITDFLASCGGLLGLFIGFSFLSVVEIIYFLTLRLFCNMKKYGRHFWSGAPELITDDDYAHKN